MTETRTSVFIVSKRNDTTGEWEEVKRFTQHDLENKEEIVPCFFGLLAKIKTTTFAAKTNFALEAECKVEAVKFAKDLFVKDSNADVKVQTAWRWFGGNDDDYYRTKSNNTDYWSGKCVIWSNGKWSF